MAEFDFYTGEEIIEILNTSIDDVLDTDEAIIHLNFGIARVNSFCKTTFPRLKQSNLEEQYPLPDTYVDTIVIEWARWHFKHKEEDVNGAISFQSTMNQPMFDCYNFYVSGGHAEDYRLQKDVYEMTTYSNDLTMW